MERIFKVCRLFTEHFRLQGAFHIKTMFSRVVWLRSTSQRLETQSLLVK